MDCIAFSSLGGIYGVQSFGGQGTSPIHMAVQDYYPNLPNILRYHSSCFNPIP